MGLSYFNDFSQSIASASDLNILIGTLGVNKWLIAFPMNRTGAEFSFNC